MKKQYSVELKHEGQCLGRELFNSEEAARKFYKTGEAPSGMKLELWVYHPPVKVVMGNTISMGWQLVESKEGMEEFA